MDNQDPQERLANARKEFGEWGGVNASIEVSTTFTGNFHLCDVGLLYVMDAGCSTYSQREAS
jgi:hypothetical protein